MTMSDAGTALSTGETEALFDRIFAGRLPEEELIGYLSATADRKPTVDELVGAVRSMRRHMRAIAAPPGAIDLCGTGGDGLGTLNISTAVSFVAAASGVVVAKHGNRSASSRSGAADVLEALGVRIAQTHHPAMKYAANARRQIGRRTILNLLGPLANPAGVTRQLVGVFSADWLTPYAEALGRLGSERAWVVHGRDGLDEVSISGQTAVAVLDAGRVAVSEIGPADARLNVASLAAIRGGDARHNAAALRRLLAGEPGPYRDIVVINAAAALIAAGKADSLAAGAMLAAEALDSGAAGAKLNALIAASNA
jgi:anthranilate phosphoribosyltransferase